ncbi:hypothetical protein [Saccharothrix australiensis]|uniref:Uncharacterized protein n=1 Tax=Saccharothrix australiensis TaxID=2072 RepID=A0A495VST6_9PSEU|nr:hypothetical protein [Saccharothrix australiensis]RKT52436.1 hypothetical protein C8E97_0946 [Saccharothrix australiensis]
MTATLADEVPEPGGSTSFAEAEFEALIQGILKEDPPRLFAIVEEYGEREDAHVGAWGLAFSDHAEVITTEGTLRVGTQSADSALRFFKAPNITPRVVWADGLDDTWSGVTR